MPNLKINQDLFIGNQELNRFKTFLVDQGYKKLFKNSISSFGIIRLPSDINFDNLKIVEGSTPAFVSINPGFAIDSNVDDITVNDLTLDVMAIPTDNALRYIFISYDTSTEEEGTLSISTAGILTGVGTKFTEVLRGQPNFPIKIVLTNSVSNLFEYEVLSVTSDTVAQLSGASFTAEVDLIYSVIGTFTPNISVPTGSKNIYEYDSYTLTLSNTNNPTAGLQFTLCSVLTDGVTMLISDLRGSSQFSLNASSVASNMTMIASPFLGVEQVMFSNIYSDKSKSIVRVGWGFRSTTGNWTPDVANNKITITAGLGGIYTSVANVVAGDFDGWRCYFVNSGRYANIVTSTIPAGTVVLQLDFYDTAFATTGEVIIVPNAEEIEIIAGSGSFPKSAKESYFAIAFGYADILFERGAIGISYRYKMGDNYSPFFSIRDGAYNDERSFDDNGVFVSSITSSVSSGILTMRNESLIRWQQATNPVAGDIVSQEWTPVKDGNSYNFSPLVFTTGSNVTIKSIKNLGNGTKILLYNNDTANGNHLVLSLAQIATVGWLQIRSKFQENLSLNTIHIEPDPGDCVVLEQVNDEWLVVGVGKYISDAIKLKANKAVEAWRLVGAAGQPVFTNSWVNETTLGAALSFRKNDMGLVSIIGTVKNGALLPIFTLPAGYRPAALKNFLIGATDITNGFRNTINVLITTAGVVSMQAAFDNHAVAMTANQCLLYLDTIQFYID